MHDLLHHVPALGALPTLLHTAPTAYVVTVLDCPLETVHTLGRGAQCLVLPILDLPLYHLRALGAAVHHLHGKQLELTVNSFP